MTIEHEQAEEIKWRRQAEVCLGLETEELGDEPIEPWVCVYRQREYEGLVQKAMVFHYVLEDVPDWIGCPDRYASKVDYKAVLAVWPFPKRMRDAEGELWTLHYDAHQYQSEASCPECECCDDCQAKQEWEYVKVAGLTDAQIWDKILAGDTLAGNRVDKTRMLMALSKHHGPEHGYETYEKSIKSVNSQDVEDVLDRYFHREGHFVEGKECQLCEGKPGQPHGYISIEGWTIAVYKHEPTFETEIRRLRRKLAARPTYEAQHYRCCLEPGCRDLPFEDREYVQLCDVNTRQELWSCPNCEYAFPYQHGVILNGMIKELQFADEVEQRLRELVEQAYAEVIAVAEQERDYTWVDRWFKYPLNEDEIRAVDELLGVMLDEQLDAVKPYPDTDMPVYGKIEQSCQ